MEKPRTRFEYRTVYVILIRKRRFSLRARSFRDGP